jgi:hypothetical protein
LSVLPADQRFLLLRSRVSGAAALVAPEAEVGGSRMNWVDARHLSLQFACMLAKAKIARDPLCSDPALAVEASLARSALLEAATTTSSGGGGGAQKLVLLLCNLGRCEEALSLAAQVDAVRRRVTCCSSHASDAEGAAAGPCWVCDLPLIALAKKCMSSTEPEVEETPGRGFASAAVQEQRRRFAVASHLWASGARPQLGAYSSGSYARCSVSSRTVCWSHLSRVLCTLCSASASTFASSVVGSVAAAAAAASGGVGGGSGSGGSYSPAVSSHNYVVALRAVLSLGHQADSKAPKFLLDKLAGTHSKAPAEDAVTAGSGGCGAVVDGTAGGDPALLLRVLLEYGRLAEACIYARLLVLANISVHGSDRAPAAPLPYTAIDAVLVHTEHAVTSSKDNDGDAATGLRAALDGLRSCIERHFVLAVVSE